MVPIKEHNKSFHLSAKSLRLFKVTYEFLTKNWFLAEKDDFLRYFWNWIRYLHNNGEILIFRVLKKVQNICPDRFFWLVTILLCTCRKLKHWQKSVTRVTVTRVTHLFISSIQFNFISIKTLQQKYIKKKRHIYNKIIWRSRLESQWGMIITYPLLHKQHT